MPEVGVPELLIIAVIALLIFGPAKVADVGGALGKSIREFRKASREDDTSPQLLASTTGGVAPAEPVSPRTEPIATNATTEEVRFCSECGLQNRADQNFCSHCGASMKIASA